MNINVLACLGFSVLAAISFMRVFKLCCEGMCRTYSPAARVGVRTIGLSFPWMMLAILVATDVRPDPVFVSLSRAGLVLIAVFLGAAGTVLGAGDAATAWAARQLDRVFGAMDC